MNVILRNIAAVILGWLLGSVVNMGLITVGPMLIPPPEGVDPADMESLKANIHLFQPKHFVFPFLAHALGTLVGALVAFKVAGSRKAVFAWVIAIFFFAGGIAVNMMIPGPVWFSVLDIVGAYIPMGWLAVRIGSKKSAPA